MRQQSARIAGARKGATQRGVRLQARFDFGDLGELSFDIPEAETSLPSSFFFGVKKGGSTLLASIVRSISPFSPLDLLELPRLVFSKGLPLYRCVRDVDRVLNRPGYAFGTFRWLPDNWLIDLHAPVKRRYLWLVRDPRDMLVSLYYSDAKSHAIPGSGPLRERMLHQRNVASGLSIDDYVMDRGPLMLRNYYRTMQLDTVGATVLRYEDVIYSKQELVRAVAEFLDVDASDRLIAQIAADHDVILEGERPSEHIRRAHPGDHENKLKPSTIEYLTDLFRLVLVRFGYI